MRHGPNRANAKVLLFAAFAFALIGLFLLLLGLGRSYMSDKLTFSGIGAFTILLGAGSFLAYRGQLKMAAVVYADGFVFANWRGQHSVFLWDDVTEVYESANYFNSRNRPASWTYVVYQGNGRHVKLNSAIQDVARLGHTVQAEARERMLPRAIRAYRAGETVAFGPKIGFNRHGLVSGQKTLDWDQVTEIQFSESGDVWIGQKEQRGAWLVVIHALVANYTLFKMMIRRIVELRPPDVRPVIRDRGGP